MGNSLGITQEGLKTALRIRDDYRHRRPLILPGQEDRMLHLGGRNRCCRETHQ